MVGLLTASASSRPTYTLYGTRQGVQVSSVSEPWFHGEHLNAGRRPRFRTTETVSGAARPDLSRSLVGEVDPSTVLLLVSTRTSVYRISDAFVSSHGAEHIDWRDDTSHRVRRVPLQESTIQILQLRQPMNGKDEQREPTCVEHLADERLTHMQRWHQLDPTVIGVL